MGPQNVNPRETAFGSLEDLEKKIGLNGWDYFEKQFAPAVFGDEQRPADEIMQALARLAELPDTRRVVDWLLDLTCRAPYPRTFDTTENLAFAAAKHQARAAVGEVIVKAIHEGRQINEGRKEPRR